MRAYDDAILDTLRASDGPLLMRDLVQAIAPDEYGAFSNIGSALTRLYSAGKVDRTKPGRWYAYIYVDQSVERVSIQIDSQVWTAFQAACERRGVASLRALEVLLKEQTALWSLVYEEA